MTRKHLTRVPTYRLHKPSGQAVVTLCGRDFYLGEFGTDESCAEYERVTAEWLLNGRRLPRAPGDIETISVAEVMVAFLEFAISYYRKHGEETKEVTSIKEALRPLRRLYSATLAAGFGPRMLKTVREQMIESGLSRTTINNRIARVKRMFKWAVAEELVPSSVYHGLQAVSGLRRGRSKAPDPLPVESVPDGAFEATLPFLPPPVAAMAQLQYWTGMRPGEVIQMRTADVERDGKIWIYTPRRHKTEHHGIERHIPIGPRAQEVLRPWLRLDTEASLFSPKEAEAARNAEKRRNRRSPMTPSQAKRKPRKNRKRPTGDAYTADSYRRAITHACDQAGVDRWSPNQLRHSAATRIRKEEGLEAARVVLGHQSAAVTEIYAELDKRSAETIMGRLG